MPDEERGAAATEAPPNAENKDADRDKDTDKDTDERTRVLRMVAEGRITVDEAVELLKALAPDAEGAHEAPGHPGPWQYGRPGPWAQGWFFGPGGPGGPGGPFRQQFQQHFQEQFGRGFGPFQQGRRGANWRGGWRPGRGGRPGGPPPPAGGPDEDVVFTMHAPVPPVPPVPPFWGSTNRVLIFEVHFEGNRYSARLPIGLVSDYNRYLPRPVRTALEAVEVDIGQLIEVLNNMDEHGGTLIDLEHEGNRVKVRVEIPGHPELGTH